ncbi:MAG: ATP-dependent DNA helicase RecG [Gemmatimonadaceae bacterium]
MRPRRREEGTVAAPALTLATPVMYLKGVGPARAEALARLAVTTAGDLLYHIPHRYEDASTVSPISSLSPGMDATIIGRVVSKGVLPTRKGLRIFQAVVKDESGLIEVSWPGQPFLDRQISKGDVLLLSGPVRFYHGRQLAPREMVNLGDEAGHTLGGRVLSVYPATEGLSFKVVRSLIDNHLDALLPLVREYVPRDILDRAGVPTIAEALRMVHRPASMGEAIAGRSRLAFEELFFVQVLHRRARELARTARDGIAFVNRKDLTRQLRDALPYTLTGAQRRTLREIVDDMTSRRRMHRLLQGDVGSGKTIVALFAALLALENGYQAAIMAPTELLAEQHFRTIGRLLNPLGISPVLVTGRVTAGERRAIAGRIGGDQPLLAIGTHALVQQAITFGRLGFVAIDEQHRFGVEQRAALRAKGEMPDALLMSATPIPRSLALTMYGDLDVSILDERPPGRRPVTTALRPAAARTRILAFVDREIAQGRQAYIVYPVIEESEKSDLRAATTMYEALSHTPGPLAERRLALLHGRLPGDERDDVMRRFLAGTIDVLVATTVIEVGIDVPNATVMVIEHPERFGLSQLHQMRGRVGRGGEQSYCVLLGDVSPDARERLSLFVASDDGFEIARADMRLRGMGDLFGERQSGVPTFRVADPLRDEELNERAVDAATRLLLRDPELVAKEHAGLRRALGERYSRSLELFRVG